MWLVVGKVKTNGGWLIVKRNTAASQSAETIGNPARAYISGCNSMD